MMKDRWGVRALTGGALLFAVLADPLQPPVSFWPLPRSVSFGNVSTPISHRIGWSGESAQYIYEYAERLFAKVFVNEPSDEPTGAISSCLILVADPDARLRVGLDESYSLNVSSTGCTLSAKTVYGAHMGLQTLSQAIRFNFDSQRYEVAGTPLIINDAPQFSWRGILIDTDRHWLSIPTIMQIIDALTYTKLNVLHWHLVDWQSWPMQSAAYPNLWSAAWSKRERYTFSDVKKVVAYAASQGVVVVPEFDTPGHASSMYAMQPATDKLTAGNMQRTT